MVPEEQSRDRPSERPLGPVPGDFVTIKEAAARLGVSYGTIRNAILAGKLAAFKILGTYRIRPADLDAFVASCRVEPLDPRVKVPVPGPTTLTFLDGAKLRAAWSRQGVHVPRKGGDSARSSESTRDPSAAPGS